MNTFRFGVSLIFFSSAFDEALIQELTTAGVETFEINAHALAASYQRDIARHLLARSKPRVSSMHALYSHEYDISRLDKIQWKYAVDRALDTVDLAAELNIPMIVMHSSQEPVPPEERPLRLERAMEGFSIIGKKAQIYDIRIAIEYLPRSCLGNSLEELNLLVDRLGDETFGVCLDVNHLGGKYTELPDTVRSLGSRLIATHISDCDEVDEKHWIPGLGVLPWPAIVQALREIDYKGPFTYECEVEGASLPDKLGKLRENYYWLESLI